MDKKEVVLLVGLCLSVGIALCGIALKHITLLAIGELASFSFMGAMFVKNKLSSKR